MVIDTILQCMSSTVMFIFTVYSSVQLQTMQWEKEKNKTSCKYDEMMICLSEIFPFGQLLPKSTQSRHHSIHCYVLLFLWGTGTWYMPGVLNPWATAHYQASGPQRLGHAWVGQPQEDDLTLHFQSMWCFLVKEKTGSGPGISQSINSQGKS